MVKSYCVRIFRVKAVRMCAAKYTIGVAVITRMNTHIIHARNMHTINEIICNKESSDNMNTFCFLTIGVAL